MNFRKLFFIKEQRLQELLLHQLRIIKITYYNNLYRSEF